MSVQWRPPRIGVAAGVGATGSGDIASRLSAHFDEPVINLGVSGDTTTDGLARIDDVLASDPKVVIVLLGGNDAIKRVPMETIFSNLEQIIVTD